MFESEQLKGTLELHPCASKHAAGCREPELREGNSGLLRAVDAPLAKSPVPFLVPTLARREVIKMEM